MEASGKPSGYNHDIMDLDIVPFSIGHDNPIVFFMEKYAQNTYLVFENITGMINLFLEPFPIFYSVWINDFLLLQ